MSQHLFSPAVIMQRKEGGVVGFSSGHAWKDEAAPSLGWLVNLQPILHAHSCPYAKVNLTQPIVPFKMKLPIFTHCDYDQH